MLLLIVATIFVGSCGRSSTSQQGENQGGGDASSGADVQVKPKTVETSMPDPSLGEATQLEQPEKLIGEAVSFPGFDLRVLDYFVTDKYMYADFINPDGSVGTPEVFPTAGKFIVVNYSIRNTGSESVDTVLSAHLNTEAGETYLESEDAEHPNSGGFGIELPPRGVTVGQFIFDVPTDVEPSSILAGIGFHGEFDSQPAQVDLTQADLPGAGPEEALALQYEYINMFAWEEAYNLFDSRSKALVSLPQYVEYMRQGDSTAIVEYSFPSVRIAGNRATMQRVFTLNSPDGEAQDQATQEAVLEDERWKVVMRDNQLEALGVAIEETTQ